MGKNEVWNEQWDSKWSGIDVHDEKCHPTNPNIHTATQFMGHLTLFVEV